MILRTKDINKSFGNLHVLKDIDLSVDEAEIVAIVGSSGAGKTTLLQILGTLDQADSGELWIEGEEVSQRKQNELSQFRNEQIGFIFQFHHLLPEFTALENVCLPAYIKGTSKTDAERQARILLQILGVDDRRTHKPSELSGGEQQRVSVARALINQPAIVLADEPSGNLDTANSTTLYKLMSQLRDELGQTFLVVTHDEILAKSADRSLSLIDGKLQNLASGNAIS